MSEITKRIASISPAKRALLLQMLESKRGKANSSPLVPRKVKSPTPLSFAQQRLWFLDQWEPGSTSYNIFNAVLIRGPLRREVFAQALNEIVGRHEALRTTFDAVDGQAVQVIAPSQILPLPLKDLRTLEKNAQDEQVATCIADEARQPFDLGSGPLVRASLLQLAEKEHILLLTMHHIVSDGWSFGVLIKEMGSLYRAFLEGKPSPLPELTIQYADFALWQRQWLDGSVREAQLAYWKEQLAGAPPLEIPTDKPRPPVQRFQGASLHVPLPKDTMAALDALSQRTEATLFMTLLAAFDVLLARISGSEDVCVGTPVAGRNRADVEGLIGLFVNTIVLRTHLEGDPSFLELLDRVRETTLSAFDHQDVPFDQVVDAIQPPRDLSRNPLFLVSFVLQNTPLPKVRLDELEISPLPVETTTAKFDLTLTIEGTSDDARAIIEYNTDLFEAPTICRLWGHFETLLAGIVAHPELPISALPLLTEAERDQLSTQWNRCELFPVESCVHQLFEAQAERSPDAIALTFEGTSLSYRDLNTRANQLAHRLRALGVGPDVLVGLSVERSLEMVVGILGILKAGGAYVPLDPAYPRQRLSFMVQDAQLSVLLTQHKLLEQLPEHRATVLCLDSDWEQITYEPDSNPKSDVRPEHLAYVIYTSGSTGNPKGVLVEHRNVVRLFHANETWFHFDARDVWTLFHSYAFDFSVWEIWGALLYGGRLVVVPFDVSRSPEAFHSLMVHEGVTVLNQTPSAFRQLVAVDASAPADTTLALRFVIFGGEALDLKSLKPWFERHGDQRPLLVNMYGITETTVHVTYRPIRNEDLDGHALSPIGCPIPDLQVYLLDRHQKLVPIGVAGEIHVGGAGVARGYLNRPELTAQRFIHDPFSEDVNARLYKAGDLARRLPDGSLEYLGRIDHQVKIRGFRIELGEIEAAISQHPTIGEVVVIVREDTPGDKRLVAYIVPRDGLSPSSSELRSLLKEKLPEYMVPAAFVTLDNLPLTTNGKVDRRALPAPILSRPELERSFVAPRTLAEKTLVDVWSHVLGVARVGVEDNFFELGGDSILSIQVITRARRAGLVLTPKQLFEHPTVAELAQIAKQGDTLAAEQGLVTGPAPLTPIQHWFFEHPRQTPQHFNQATLTELRKPIDPGLLEQALHQLLLHHDALRLRFQRTEEGWSQRLAGPDAAAISLLRQDLSALPEEEIHSAIQTIAARLQASLDLENGPLVHAALFELGQERPSRLLVVIHHLAVDGVSWRILFEDLELACEQLCRGEALRLPPKTTSFKRWAEQLRVHARSAAVESELSLWQRGGQVQASRLPVDFPNGANTVASARTLSLSLSAQETRALLHDLPEVYHTQINDVLLTAWTLAISRWTGVPAALFDLEGHGREDIGPDIDVSRTVGWFTTIFPVCLLLRNEVGPGEALKSIKEQLRRIPHRGIGYGLLRYLNSNQEITDACRALPTAEVSFNYLGQTDAMESASCWFSALRESIGPDHAPGDTRRHLLDVLGIVARGQLQLELIYSENLHRKDTIDALAREFVSALRLLIAHCSSPEAGGYTPSDFPLAKLDQATLDRLFGADRQIEDVYPLTALQQGMLFHSLCAPTSGVYVEQLLCTLVGKLDEPALLRSWQRVLERYPNLRVAIAWQGIEEPLQIVRKDARMPVEEYDLRGLSPTEREARFSAFLMDDRARGFELSQAPLMRLALLRMEETTYRFVWSHHHMLLDGWSIPLLLEEIFKLYAAYVEGRDIDLPRRRAYRDYAQWLNELDLSHAESFWRDTLRGFTAPTPLNFIQRSARSSSGEEGYGELIREIRTDAVQTLSTFARTHRLTLNTLVQGAWALLLSSYSRETDIVFGVTVSGRPAEVEGAEQMIGVFINTLPMRVEVSPGMAVLSFLQRCQETQVHLRQYEYTPLSQVNAWSDVPRGQSLFDTIVVFENFPHDESASQLPGLEIKDVHAIEQTNYPLTLIVAPAPDRLQVRLLYARALFDAHTVERMLDHVEILLEAFVANRERPLASLGILTPAERQHLLGTCNATHTEFHENGFIPELIEAQAERTPEAIAVSFEGRHLTYGQLNRMANQLAHHLRARGLGLDALVGIAAERSLEMVIGLLGILKAGAAYVPLDPSYPSERLRIIVEEIRPEVLLTQEHLRGVVPQEDVEVLCLDSDWPEIGQARDDNPRVSITGGHLAYVIYTSGSTGRPKGVMNTHAGLRNRLLWMQDAYQLTSTDVVLQKTPYSFDVSVWEFFWPLLAGARLVVARPEGHRDVAYLIALIRSEAVTTIHFVPSMLQPMVDDADFGACKSLKRVICSGEALPFELTERFFARNQAELHNLYGPTEASIDVTAWQCQRADPRQIVPIGRPIANTQLYVLNDQLEPAPLGVPGELYIGGIGVARGYLCRPDLTADRFIPDPFGQTPGMRLYKTGDLARWLQDGSLEYLGRLDYQVKIRGFRIELGEIEAVLTQHPLIREAVVVAREDVPGEKRLVAYIIVRDGAKPSISSSMLRGFLSETLPIYMVPAAFVVLEALPLTHSGKVDRRALPSPERGNLEPEGEIVAPKTLSEETLVRVLKQILNSERVSIDDNFFDLGGDSILAIQVVNKAQQAGLKLTLQQILECPTIADLAAAAAPLEDELDRRAVTVLADQGLVTGDLPLIPIQHWFFERSLFNPHYFNQCIFIELGEALDPTILRRAIQELLCHHDALRLRFNREGSTWRQRIDPPSEPIPFEIIDLTSVPDERLTDALEQAAAAIQASLRLDEGPLLRVGFFDLGPLRSGRLLIVIHHLAIDGVSWRVLTEDLQTAYGQLLEGQPLRLPPKTTSFKQWAEKLSAYAQSDLISQEMSYWTSISARSKLPFDVSLGANTVASSKTITVSLTPEETRVLLQDIPKIYGTRINDALLTALGFAFAPWTGAHELTVDLEGHGREPFSDDVDASRTIGWFTTLFPVRLELPEGPPEQVLLAVQKQMRSVPGRGLGYGLLRYLHGDPEVRNALRTTAGSQVVFNYLGQFTQHLSESSLFRMAKEQGGPSTDSSETRAHLIEINSLVIEDKLQVQWTYSENFHLRSTIEQLVDRYMASLRALLAASASPEAQRRSATPNANAEASAHTPSLLVRIQSAGAERPLFFVHGGGGTVLFYAELARHLGSDRPFYGIQARGVDDEQPPNRRIEDMAAQYISAVRTVQPEGPYLLGGYSFGTLVAFEMAHQLSEAGQPVGLLALFDMPPESAAGYYEGWDDAMILSDIFRVQGLDISTEDLRKMSLHEQINHVLFAARAAQTLPPSVGERDLLRLLAIYKAHSEARLSYKPPVYRGRITLFRARVDAPEPAGWPLNIRRDPTLGWSRYCQQSIDIYEVQGEHETLLKEPNVRIQAELLRQRLRDVDRMSMHRTGMENSDVRDHEANRKHLSGEA